MKRLVGDEVLDRREQSSSRNQILRVTRLISVHRGCSRGHSADYGRHTCGSQEREAGRVLAEILPLVFDFIAVDPNENEPAHAHRKRDRKVVCRRRVSSKI
jgi:hypothetical protein